MAVSKADELIRFPCECGAVLTARVSQTGHKGKCKRCGRIMEIPEPSPATVSAPSADAVAVQEVCSICQTVVEDDDEVTVCDACGLPFHEECWQENLGCSAYGCWNVNALKTGPDIKVDNLRPEGVPEQMFANRQPAQRPMRKQQPEAAPWDYVTMAACAVGFVFSMLTFGTFSLFTIALSVAVVRSRTSQQGLAIPVTCFVLSGLGVICGMVLSRLFWFA